MDLGDGITKYFDDVTKDISPKGLSTLLNVSSALASTLELSDVLQIAIESAVDLLSLDTGAIYTLDEVNLYLGATTPPLPNQFPEELRLAQIDDHPHIKKAITTKAPVYIPEVSRESLSSAEKVVVDSRNLISILYFPLLLKDAAIGAFIVGTTGNVRRFTKDEIGLCHALSCQSALAISNAQLYEQAQQALVDLTQAYDATLEGWSFALDMRDHDTDQHTHRVTELTITLAKRMGIPELKLEDIRRGALLHDIGKMGIPDAILCKPSTLSKSEWVMMKKHPELACQLLSKIEYLKPAIDIPYCHHEKWDGSGYPRKLKGEEIPFSARIFAVVDVFDALTSDRPYRKAWTNEEAVKYIKEQSGKHFAPDIVQVFLEILNEQ